MVRGGYIPLQRALVFVTLNSPVLLAKWTCICILFQLTCYNSESMCPSLTPEESHHDFLPFWKQIIPDFLHFQSLNQLNMYARTFPNVLGLPNSLKAFGKKPWKFKQNFKKRSKSSGFACTAISASPSHHAWITHRVQATEESWACKGEKSPLNIHTTQ